MFKLILDLLNVSNLYGVSKEIDIAKGINHIQNSTKDTYNQLVRIIKQKN